MLMFLNPYRGLARVASVLEMVDLLGCQLRASSECYSIAETRYYFSISSQAVAVGVAD